MEKANCERPRLTAGLMMPGGEVLEVAVENFGLGVASGGLGVRDVRQGILLCLGGLLAMVRGAKGENGVVSLDSSTWRS